jgi:hypothetical protein
LRLLPGFGVIGPLLVELGLNGLEQRPIKDGWLFAREDLAFVADLANIEAVAQESGEGSVATPISLATRSTSVASIRPSAARCSIATRPTTILLRREIAGIDANRLMLGDSAVSICKDEPQHSAVYSKKHWDWTSIPMTTNADSEVGEAMSALPPKADMCGATRNVR